MKFTETVREGVIMGNAVRCKPVPLSLAYKCMTAKTDVERVTAVCDVVRECVTMADGSAIEPNDLSMAAVGALGDFAFAKDDGNISDFTVAR